MKLFKFIIVLLIWSGGFLLGTTYNINTPKMDLPEEYKLINTDTPIIGYYDKDSILHIEFDNKIKFEWEGLEKDIPNDGIRELQLTTEGNTIYLDPVDK